MKVISKIKVFIKDVLWLGMVNKFLYGPRKTLPFSEIVKRSNEIRVHEVIPAIKSNLTIEKDLIAATNTPEIRDYKPEIIINAAMVAEIENGILMTDKSDVAIMTSDRLLLEQFSFHYEIEPGNRAFRSQRQERNNLFNTRYYHPPEKIKGTVLNMQTGGGGNIYYHFLLDILPGYYLAEKAGLIKNIDYYYFQTTEKDYQKEALKTLNIDPSRVITNKNVLHFKADRLITFTHPNSRFHIPMWNIEFLRKKFLKK